MNMRMRCRRRRRFFLTKIQQATARMLYHDRRRVDYSVVTGSEQPIAEVDLNQVVDQIEADLELVIRERGAVIRRGELPRVEGAPVLIYQLFYNLVNNALKFAKLGDNPLVTT